MSLATDNMSSHSDVTSLMIIFPASSPPCTISCLSAPGYLHRRKYNYVGAALLLLQFETGQYSPMRDSSDCKSTLSDVSSISLPFWILMTVIDSLGCLYFLLFHILPRRRASQLSYLVHHCTPSMYHSRIQEIT